MLQCKIAAERILTVTKTSKPVVPSFILLPNVQDEPRPQLARNVRLGAHSVTAVVVGSGAWFGSVVWVI